MTLKNLWKIGSLQEHAADAPSIRKLLESARRNLDDARVVAISTETRFDAAYKCIMQCAILGLWAQGFRTSTSKPGHHQTAIQALVHSMDVERETMVVLEGLRKRRNISDYEGDGVTESLLATCIEEAAKLLAHTERWLATNRADLMA
jgi:hypothetical protein